MRQPSWVDPELLDPEWDDVGYIDIILCERLARGETVEGVLISAPSTISNIGDVAHCNNLVAGLKRAAWYAELDARRRAHLAERVAEAPQVLITAAVADDVPAAMAGTWFDVVDGTVTRRSGGPA